MHRTFYALLHRASIRVTRVPSGRPRACLTRHDPWPLRWLPRNGCACPRDGPPVPRPRRRRRLRPSLFLHRQRVGNDTERHAGCLDPAFGAKFASSLRPGSLLVLYMPVRGAMMGERIVGAYGGSIDVGGRETRFRKLRPHPTNCLSSGRTCPGVTPPRGGRAARCWALTRVLSPVDLDRGV